MQKQSESLVPRYEEKRNAVFVLGAGASWAEGTPLQSDLLPMMLCDPAISESKLGVRVTLFLRDQFALARDVVPTLESVFGYLDYLLLHRESLPGYTLSQLGETRQALIKLLHYLIDAHAPDRPIIYRRFWESAQAYSLNIGVVTTNYDCLLEEAFDFLYPRNGLIDYCIPLMNYELYEEYAQEIGPFNWWLNPRGPIPNWSEKVPCPIKIIKLHGSLNWKYCPCCGQVLLTPWDSQVDLERDGFVFEVPSEGRLPGSSREFTCPWDGSRFETIILPPSHMKELTQPVISRLRVEAAQELRCTGRVVFVGYSFPESDVHLKALFRKNLRKDCEIVVINRSLSPQLENSFLGLGRPVSFNEMTFEQFLDSPTLLAGVFGGSESCSRTTGGGK